MSNGSKDNGVVIDVVPEQTATSGRAKSGVSTPPPNPAAPAKPFGLLAKSGNSIGLIALVFALVLAVFGYVHWANSRHDLRAFERHLNANSARQEELNTLVQEANQAVHEQQGVLAEQEARLRATLAENRKAAAAQRRALEQRERQLADQQAATAAREIELRDAVAEMYRRVGGSGNQWMVAEAAYLIRLARIRLQLSGDVSTARIALAQATQRLKDTRDPFWEAIRVRLAKDINALNAVVPPDQVMLTERLDRLIAQLPLTRANARTTGIAASEATQQATPSPTARERNLSNLFEDTVTGLRNAVRIRRHDQPLQPLPGSAQDFFHNQNLQLQLTIAQLAVARRQTTLYQRSLGQAAQVLDTLGTLGHAAAQAMREEIDSLAAIAIAPQLPDFEATLRALETRLSQHYRRGPDANAAAPAGTKE